LSIACVLREAALQLQMTPSVRNHGRKAWILENKVYLC
jgi:hypothetical protein